MADQYDVENALVALVAATLYPAGPQGVSAVGRTCRIYRGLPAAAALAADLALGVVNISVAGNAKIENTTRYPRAWQSVPDGAALMTVSVTAQSVSFGGSCTVGQLAGVAVNGAVFSYAVQAVDTPQTVASHLAAMLRAAGWLVNYAGAGLQVPGAAMLVARVVQGAKALLEIRRQKQEFELTLWCPDPWSRDECAALVDLALAGSGFIELSDGSCGRVVYGGSESSDLIADAGLYKRILRYQVEYPTTQTQTMPAMLFGDEGFAASGSFVETLSI